MLERRAPIACRLAALFALLDYKIVIAPEHMRAALAWADYHRRSVEYLFSGDEPARKKAAKQAEIEEKIITYLTTAADWVSRTDITRSAFSNHISKEDLSSALDALLLARKITQVERPRANGVGTHKLYRLRHGSSAPSHRHDLDNAITHHAANRANQDQQTDRVSRLSHDSQGSSLNQHDSDQPMAESDEPQDEEQRVEEALQHSSEPPHPAPPVDGHQVVH